VIGETISVLPVSQSVVRNPDSETCITDDRGVYRVYGLEAGRYVVSVGSGNQNGLPFTLRATHPPTFYPGVTSRDRAGIVDVTAGAEASRIDIKLGQPSQTYQATGRVLDDAGKPVANIVVVCASTVAENGAVTPSISTLHTNSKGEFKVEGLAPGRYSASANFMYDPDSDLYSDTARFEVKYADVAGVDIKVHRGLSISGVALLEGTDDPGILGRLTQLELWATVLSPEGSGYNLSRSKILPDYSFRLTGLHPGKVQIMLNTLAQVSPFAILRVEQNGVPQKDGIEVGLGDQLSGIRVVFGYGNCVIRGQVTVQGGELPKDTTLDVVAALSGEDGDNMQAALPGFGFAGAHSSQVDSSGRFRIEGLVPGQYEVTVTGPSNGSVPPRYPTAKQSVTVTSGSELEVNLLLDLSKSQ
jgi:protocatechuate 3,4-dioxygenase beta subunit